MGKCNWTHSETKTMTILNRIGPYFYATFLFLMAPVILWGVQTFVLPTGSVEHQTEHLTDAGNRAEALRSCFAGTSAPTSPTPIEGQCWYDSTNNVEKRYDGAAWIEQGDISSTQTFTNKTNTAE